MTQPVERELEGLERDERALEKISGALDRLATIAEKFFDRLYPEKLVVRDAKLTTVQTPEEKELEATIQGGESSLDEWREIGPREQAFLDQQSKKKSS